MPYQFLTRAIRQASPTTNGAEWEPPSPDTRYILAGQLMETVFVALCDEREFLAELTHTAAAGLIVGPVMHARLYQRRADGPPDYAVYFVAVISLRYSRVELRRHCGDQDMDQATEGHPPSRLAAQLEEQLAGRCRQLGIECRQVDYGEIR